MAELTIEQTIKIILGVLVVTAVVISITLGFKSYIIPYFNSFFPSEEIDTSTPFYQELMKPDNLIASLGSDGKMITEKYYLSRNKIWEKREGVWWNPFTYKRDPEVGAIDEKQIVHINEAYSKGNYLGESILNDLDSSTFVKEAKAFFKKR